MLPRRDRTQPCPSPQRETRHRAKLPPQLEIPSPLIPASPKNVSVAPAQSAHPSDAPTPSEIATRLPGSWSSSSSGRDTAGRQPQRL